MFSVEYFSQTIIISAYNIRKINFRYQSKLRKLILQAMKQSCRKVVLNLAGVRIIEASGYEMLKFISNLASNLGVKFSIMNLDEELTHQIQTSVEEIACCIPQREEIEEFSEIIDAI